MHLKAAVVAGNISRLIKLCHLTYLVSYDAFKYARLFAIPAGSGYLCRHITVGAPQTPAYLTMTFISYLRKIVRDESLSHP